MKIGFFSMNTDFGVRTVDLARALEERGFASLWVGEHSHIPSSRRTAYPAGGDLPKGYWHMLDPFVSLGAAAAVTTKLRLGTGRQPGPRTRPRGAWPKRSRPST